MTGDGGVCITFVLGNLRRDWPELASLAESDIEEQPGRFVGGRNSWIAQGYLRLRADLLARGHRVQLSDHVMPDTISIVHRDDLNAFRSTAHSAFLVVVRADRAPVLACDVAIAQNGRATQPHERFVPLWPQPGLSPRDRRRPSRVRRIVYQGRTGTLPRWFAELSRSPELASRGVRFEVRSTGWHDYRNADLVLAAREDADVLVQTKPGTKIYNAWLAGVPVLAAPEPAYRELWRSHLDFMEVAGVEDVVGAVDRLNASPTLYGAMVANGEQRGRAFDVGATRARWMALLDEEVIPQFRRIRPSLGARRAWFLRAMLRQKVASRAWRLRLAIGRWTLRSPWEPIGILERVSRGIAAVFAAAPEHSGADRRTAFR